MEEPAGFELRTEVLAAAEYVFRKDKTRTDYYYSSYRSRQRNSSKPETDEEETAVPVEATAN